MSDPTHPEGWRIARDLDDRQWDDDGYDPRDGGSGWPTAWTDPEAVDALDRARHVAAQRNRS